MTPHCAHLPTQPTPKFELGSLGTLVNSPRQPRRPTPIWRPSLPSCIEPAVSSLRNRYQRHQLRLRFSCLPLQKVLYQVMYFRHAAKELVSKRPFHLRRSPEILTSNLVKISFNLSNLLQQDSSGSGGFINCIINVQKIFHRVFFS